MTPAVITLITNAIGKVSMKTRASLIVAASALALAACAGSAPDRFYRLATRSAAPAAVTAVSPAASAALAASVVAVTAVSVPDLVDRPQIVTLNEGSRVQISEQNRWAEPLKLAIGRLVAERISAQLGSPLVFAYPADSGVEPNYRVNLSVQRFDAELGTSASVTMLWTVRRIADGQLRVGRSALSVTPVDASYAALVEAQADAIARIGDEIARAIATWVGPTK